MASSPSNPSAYGSPDTTPPNTTFVQADPSNFRTIVQKLTGAPEDQSSQKLPVTHHHHHHYHRANTTATTTAVQKRPAFKLHERRQQNYRNLQLNNLNNTNTTTAAATLYNLNGSSSGFLVSPVSPLDFFSARAINSPKSPYKDDNNCYTSHEEAEERAIAEKGFYLHPVSPLRKTPRGDNPPELLPLFPLTSPRDAVH